MKSQRAATHSYALLMLPVVAVSGGRVGSSWANSRTCVSDIMSCWASDLKGEEEEVPVL